MTEAVPQEVRVFLAEHVRSVMVLELMLLLRSDPGREWTVEEAARELRTGHEWLQQELGSLAARKLIVQTGAAGEPPRFRYSQNPAEPDGPIAWLAANYAERRFSIIQLIYAAPSDPVQRFADAFRLRKGPTDG